jgi:hypothetical protein
MLSLSRISLTTRNLRIVAGGLTFIGILYAVATVICVAGDDPHHALIAFLVLNVVMSLALAAWLKAFNLARAVPQWLRFSNFILACWLVFVMY